MPNLIILAPDGEISRALIFDGANLTQERAAALVQLDIDQSGTANGWTAAYSYEDPETEDDIQFLWDLETSKFVLDDVVEEDE